MDQAAIVVKELLNAMGYDSATVETIAIGGQTVFSIKNVPDSRELIGQHGDTIHAIDVLVKRIVERRLGAARDEQAREDGESRANFPMFLVDVDDYRVRHIRDLQTKAKMMAERARSFQYDVELSPMTAYERLIIHTTLQDEPHVKTESQGEGRNRRVVIKYFAG